MSRNLDFVQLTVADFAASLAWYCDVLGLELVVRDDTHGFALLRCGTGRIALQVGRPDPGTTLLTFEVDDLDADLARHGVEPVGELKTTAEGYRRALVRDPDGHLLCLFEWMTRD